MVQPVPSDCLQWVAGKRWWNMPDHTEAGSIWEPIIVHLSWPGTDDDLQLMFMWDPCFPRVKPCENDQKN